jgi:hypothetical protein
MYSVHNPWGYLDTPNPSAAGVDYGAVAAVVATPRRTLITYTRCYIDRPLRVEGFFLQTVSPATVGAEATIKCAVALFNSDGMVPSATQTGLPTTYKGGLLPSGAITPAAARTAYSISAAKNTRGLKYACTPFDADIGAYWLVTACELVYTSSDTLPGGKPWAVTNGAPWPTDSSTGDVLARNLVLDTLPANAIDSYASWSAIGAESRTSGQVVSLNTASSRTISTISVVNISQHEWAWKLICQRI